MDWTRKLFGRQTEKQWRAHRFYCGASRSGKSTGALVYLMERARQNNCAIVLLDPAAQLGLDFMAHLVHEKLDGRVLIFDDMNTLSPVPNYAIVRRSVASGLQRKAENDVFTDREMEQLGQVVGEKLAQMPVKGRGVRLALNFWKDTDLPQSMLPYMLDVHEPWHLKLRQKYPDSEAGKQLGNLMQMPARQRVDFIEPSRRLLEQVFDTAMTRVRTCGRPAALSQALEDRRIIVMNGSEAQIASDYFMSSIGMDVVYATKTHYARTKKELPVLLGFDEGSTRKAFGRLLLSYATQNLKWGCEYFVCYQYLPQVPDDPEQVRIILQNFDRQEFYRQSDNFSAVIAAQQTGSLKYSSEIVKRRDEKTRTVVERMEFVEHEGKIYQKPVHVPVTDTTITNYTPQELHLEEVSRMTSLGTGQRMVRWIENNQIHVTSQPEQVVKLDDSWMHTPSFQRKFAEALHRIRSSPVYQVPNLDGSGRARSNTTSPPQTGGKGMKKSPRS